MHYTFDLDHCEIDGSPVSGWSLNSVSIYEDIDSGEYLYSYVANIPEMTDFSYIFVATYTVDGDTYTDTCPTVKQLKTILDGSNLMSERGWPNCVGDCTYHSDYDAFSLAKDATDDIQAGTTYASFDTSGVSWGTVEIGFFRGNCIDLDGYATCTWDWSDSYAGWEIDNVYFVRDGNWGFSNYEFTV